MTYWERILYILEQYGSSFLRGAGTTMVIAILGTLVGCVIGFAVGVVQTIPVSKNDPRLRRGLLRVVRFLLGVYVEVFRGTPMMIQAVFIYYGTAQIFDVHLNTWIAALIVVLLCRHYKNTDGSIDWEAVGKTILILLFWWVLIFVILIKGIIGAGKKK